MQKPRSFVMKRILVAYVAVGLGAMVALAASPEIEAAIKTLKAIGGDAGKLKMFCDLSKVMVAIGDKDDPAAEKQIDDYVKQLGSDFEAAWNAGDDLDENSADAKEYYAVVDALEERCPKQ
jgi:hypothetical protein